MVRRPLILRPQNDEMPEAGHKRLENMVRRAFLILTLIVLTASVTIGVSGIPSYAETEGPLLPPDFPETCVETCLNSRYSEHVLSGTASDQQLSNVLWAAGKVPITGSYRDIYVATPNATYLYHPDTHSLAKVSDDVNDKAGAFKISWDRELAFDAGLTYMTSILAAVCQWDSAVSVSNCPKEAALCFGVQEVEGLKTELVATCSLSQGEEGWLPDPSTTGNNNLQEVLANLNYDSNFTQTDLTLEQVSQILWAGYGCTPHEVQDDKKGLTVPSAHAYYLLTKRIYLVNGDGVYRYHNREVGDTDKTTRDHRLEKINSNDVRDSLRSAVGGLPQAPAYFVLCIPDSFSDPDPNMLTYAQLEAGFVASNMLMQATAIDLGCYFNAGLNAGEEAGIRDATGIPSENIPHAVVSIGPVAAEEAVVDISVVLQGESRPAGGWEVPVTSKFFTPGADVLNGTPEYTFTGNTTKSDGTAIFQCDGVASGSYDIAGVSDHTLMNVSRDVVISTPSEVVDMGTLLEGNANNDDIIDISDFGILALSYNKQEGEAGYEPMADFDCNGIVNIHDFGLLAINYMQESPVESS